MYNSLKPVFLIIKAQKIKSQFILVPLCFTQGEKIDIKINSIKNNNIVWSTLFTTSILNLLTWALEC